MINLNADQLNCFSSLVQMAPELDPNTVHACLCVSDTKRELSWGETDQAHSDHPDRFTYFYQAICQRCLRRNHYWEVEWDGGSIEVTVSYKALKRKGLDNASCFGHNELSWKLVCSPSGCTLWHNNLYKQQIPPSESHKVGVLLDHGGGLLNFYGVSGHDKLTLLHQVQSIFTEPLYPGFTVDLRATLKICNI